MGNLTTQFDRELGRSLSKIEEAIDPYTRFVRTERDHLTETRGSLGSIGDGLSRLEAEINQL